MTKPISRRRLIAGAIGLGTSAFLAPNSFSQLNYLHRRRPPARDHFAATFDENRNAFVVFGGTSGPDTWFNDTWEWRKDSWSVVESSIIDKLASVSMVYDPGKKTSLLFGGISPGGKLHNRLWQWDGETWKKVSEDGPSARHSYAMSFDRNRNKLVFFGGSGRGSDLQWEWDNNGWKEIKSLKNAPKNRMRAAMAYDPIRKSIILFGGFDGKNELGDIWEWNGRDWKQIDTKCPPARNNHMMVTDYKRNRIVLFGGTRKTTKTTANTTRAVLGDTWEWNGKDARWTEIQKPGPKPRVMGGMAYDSGSNDIMLFGGRDKERTSLNDLWKFNGNEWKEITSRSN